MPNDVHTITATERRMRGVVIAAFALSAIGFAALLVRAWPLGAPEAVAAVAGALLLAQCGVYIARGRTSVGMVPLCAVGAACAGAAAHIWSIAIAGAVIALALAVSFARMHAAYAHARIPDDLAAIIVLGCAIRNRRPSPTLARRLDAALKVWETHRDAVFVPTGGAGAGASEAEVMRDYLLERGVPEGKLLVDDAALNTEQNMANSFELLDRAGIMGPAAVSSSDYHLYRALGIARGLGRELVPIAAKTPWKNRLIQWSREVLVILEWRLRSRRGR